jgi:hypothetical protein
MISLDNEVRPCLKTKQTKQKPERELDLEDKVTNGI